MMADQCIFMSKERMLICFNKNQRVRLKEESERLGSSIASVVRMAVMQYFQNEG